MPPNGWPKETAGSPKARGFKDFMGLPWELARKENQDVGKQKSNQTAVDGEKDFEASGKFHEVQQEMRAENIGHSAPCTGNGAVRIGG